MCKVNLEEAKSSLAELVEAAIGGEDVFILNTDRQLVQLVPIQTKKRQPKFGSAKGLIEMSEDFDEPLPDFGSYM